MTNRRIAHRALPFAVFDEFGHGAEDRIRDHVAAELERCAQWIRDNYQDHPTIDGLCATMLATCRSAPTAVELGRVARSLALEYAELRHEAMRALVAWDGTVLPKAHDGMMQERMECLREALDISQTGVKT